MVHETITMEGHLIDSDILRRVFDRVVEEGGEFEVAGLPRRQDERRALVRPPRGEGADPHDARPDPGRPALPRGDDRHRATRASRRPRPTASFRTSSTRRPTSTPGAHRGRWVAARRPEDGLRDRRCARRAPLREAGAGEAGRAGRPAGPRHPREAPRAEPRLLGLRLHVQRDLGRGQQERSRSRAPPARCAARGRPARRSWSWPGPAVVHSGGDVHLARLVREGWVDVLLTGNAFAVHDLEKAILKTSLGRLPDERARGRGRQPPPPLRDQRRQPRAAGFGRRSRRASSPRA